MNAQTTCKPLSLSARQTVMIKHSAGLEVRAQSGCVWITQYGDARDIMLQPGQSVALDLPTATLMSASNGAEVLLVRRATPRAARPFWRRLASLFDPRWSGSARRGLCGRLPAVRLIHG